MPEGRVSRAARTSEGATSPGQLDTSTYGAHTYAVTATSTDGLSATTTASYTVAAPPTASITSPASGGTYTLNQSVSSAFGCTEGAGGPGIAGCLDSNNQTNPGLLNTSSLGPHSYSVEAASGDGLSGQASISYTVVSPNVAPAVTSNPVSQTGYAGTTADVHRERLGHPDAVGPVAGLDEQGGLVVQLHRLGRDVTERDERVAHDL